MKPYYERNGIVIYNGDCREILPLTYTVLLTDPPYGINHPTDYADRKRCNLTASQNFPPVHEDNQPFDPKFLLDGRQAILWGANYYSSKLPDMSGWLVWDKERPQTLDQATAELAWTNCIKGVRVFRHLWNGMMRASENEPLVHPTQKPVALMKWILSFEWIKSGIVCDPFMGSGATLVACKSLGRKAVGIEISEQYCEITAKRLDSFQVLDFEQDKELKESEKLF